MHTNKAVYLIINIQTDVNSNSNKCMIQEQVCISVAEVGTSYCEGRKAGKLTKLNEKGRERVKGDL